MLLVVLLSLNRTELSRTKLMESIRFGFRLEANSVWLDLRISSHGLVRLELRLVDGTDEADGDDRQIKDPSPVSKTLKMLKQR